MPSSGESKSLTTGRQARILRIIIDGGIQRSVHLGEWKERKEAPLPSARQIDLDLGEEYHLNEKLLPLRL